MSESIASTTTGGLIYQHGIITENEYEDLIGGNSDDGLEAAFRLSETPFEKAELQPWTIEKGKILYASDIRVGKSASAVICDVLSDFLAINAEEMGGWTLRVRIEDGKLIRYFFEVGHVSRCRKGKARYRP